MLIELHIKNIKGETLRVDDYIPALFITDSKKDNWSEWVYDTELVTNGDDLLKFVKKLFHGCVELDENWVVFKLIRVYFNRDFTVVYECEIPYDAKVKGKWHVD